MCRDWSIKKIELSTALQTLRLTTEKVKEQNQILERLATRDPLTSCFNRRSFFEQFDSILELRERYNQPLSAVMVDIDHFKSNNDNHGHSVGDTVLQKVAETLMKTARETDVVARYGGEEFSILMPTRISWPQLCRPSESARRWLPSSFPNLVSAASLGVSSISQSAGGPHELLDQADKLSVRCQTQRSKSGGEVRSSCQRS